MKNSFIVGMVLLASGFANAQEMETGWKCVVSVHDSGVNTSENIELQRPVSDSPWGSGAYEGEAPESKARIYVDINLQNIVMLMKFVDGEDAMHGSAVTSLKGRQSFNL